MALADLSGWSLYPPDTGIVHSASGGTSVTLDAAEERLCTVIQIPKTGTVKKMGFYISSRGAGDAVYRATIETVAAAVGVPIAATYAGRTLYVANAESGDITIPGAAGIVWAALNGTTGVSVTAGDYAALTVRCVSRTSGSIGVRYALFGLYGASNIAFPWQYNNISSDAVSATCGNFALEYDTGIVPISGCYPAANIVANAWDSGDEPTFRGLKFTLPFPAQIGGITIGNIDYDYDFNIHAYGTDEYTEFTDFPLAVSQEQRRADASVWGRFIFKTPFTVAAGSAYRIALEPTETGANAVNWAYFDVIDDGAVPAMAGMDGGVNLVYTSINDAPTSGSHTWADVATRRPCMGLLISQLDDGASVGGSSPRFGDRSGGKY